MLLRNYANNRSNVRDLLGEGELFRSGDMRERWRQTSRQIVKEQGRMRGRQRRNRKERNRE